MNCLFLMSQSVKNGICGQRKNFPKFAIGSILEVHIA